VDYTSSVAPFQKSADWGLGVFHEDIVFHDMNTAALEANLVRGAEIYNIGEDFLRECAGFNVDIYCHEGRQPGANHSNLIQHAAGQIANCLYYGVKSRNIGIVAEHPDGILIRNLFAVPAHEGIGFVNVDVHASGNALIQHKVNHLVMKHCTFGTNHESPPSGDYGGALAINDDPPDSAETEVVDLLIRGTFAKSFGMTRVPAYRVGDPTFNGPQSPPVTGPYTADGTEEWAEYCHFIDSIAGTNNQTGETETALFTDPVNNDWSPKAGGSLEGAVPRTVPCDVNWNARAATTAIGAERAASEAGASVKQHYFAGAGGNTYAMATGGA
jgi:hypothetical protein